MHRTALGKLASVTLYVFLTLLLAINFSYNYLKLDSILLNINSYLAGTANTPYQYRALMIPAFSGLLRLFHSVNTSSLITRMPTYLNTPERLAYFSVSCVSACAAFLIFERVSSKIFGRSPMKWLSWGLFVIVTYAYFDLNPLESFILPYDMPALAFSAGLLLLYLERRWLLGGVLFALATLNRETSFILIFLVLSEAFFSSDSRERMKRLYYAFALSVVWVIIKVATFSYFRHATADVESVRGLFALRPVYNIQELLKPWIWPTTAPLYVPFAVFTYLLCKAGDRRTRAWAAAAFAAFWIFFLAANTTECRAYVDMIGITAVCLTFFLQKVLGSMPEDQLATSAP